MSTLMYVAENFYRGTCIPVHVYSHEEKKEICCYGFSDAVDPFKTDDALFPHLCDSYFSQGRPWIHLEMDFFCYCLMLDPNGMLFVLGPVCLHKQCGEILKRYIHQHHLPPDFFVPVQNISAFSSNAALLYYMLTGAEILPDDIIQIDFSFLPVSLQQNDVLETYIMDRREEDAEHFSYKQEQEKMRSIINGDVASIRKEITLEIMAIDESLIGKVAEQPRKQWEYAVVSSVTLSTRAAILGGVPPATAYALSDTMLQKLSKCTDLSGIIQLSGEVRLTFAACVRDFRNQRCSYSIIEEAKTYMRSNLNKDITLEDIAAHVNFSAPHLCRKFKEEEGITPMEYLRNSRVQAAENMLRHSSSSIAYIVQYLCFHSQSHFGTVFKKMTGMTPRQYRDSWTDIPRT